MEKAIKKAIEGGYDRNKQLSPEFSANNPDEEKYAEIMVALYRKENTHPRVCLDPLFWQALGKAEGWGYDEKNRWDNRTWASHWHRFIDHLIEGKSPEDFFNNLIK